jgi:hypothetical protein
MMRNYRKDPPTIRQNKQLAVSRLEAAYMLNISPASLDRLVRRGMINPSRSLRRPLFCIKELERFLRDTTVGGQPS